MKGERTTSRPAGQAVGGFWLLPKLDRAGGDSGGTRMTPRHAPRHWSPAPVAAALLMLLGTTGLFLHLRTPRPGPVPEAVVTTIGYSVAHPLP